MTLPRAIASTLLATTVFVGVGGGTALADTSQNSRSLSTHQSKTGDDWWGHKDGCECRDDGGWRRHRHHDDDRWGRDRDDCGCRDDGGWWGHRDRDRRDWRW
ncbi:MAG: hypothetical protein JWN35_2487 [Frankiales bacterium]|jgi:hypothetical protein|nr:hypothetical protein [Frankiales bacterium]